LVEKRSGDKFSTRFTPFFVEEGVNVLTKELEILGWFTPFIGDGVVKFFTQGPVLQRERRLGYGTI